MPRTRIERFASAEELSAELRRFVENRPIRSRPIPFYQQFWRWCKRNPALAATNIAGAALTAILAIVSTVAAFIYRDRNQQVVLDNQRIQLRRSKPVSSYSGPYKLRLARVASTGAWGSGSTALRPCAAAAIGQELKLPPDRFDRLRDEVIACLALPDLKKTGRVIHRPPEVILTAFDSTMTRYAFRFRDGTILVRRVADDGEIARFQARGDREIFVFGFSPDGRYLATNHFPGYALTVWDIDQRAVTMNDEGPVVWDAANFSPDSGRIALIHWNGDLLVYDLATRRQTGLWRMPNSQHLAFGPDGTQIAVTQNEPGNPNCRILESATGRLVRSIKLPSIGATATWGLDGTTLATPCDDLKIYLWDPATGIRKATLEGHTKNGDLHVAFHPASALVGSNGWEAQLRLWDASVGRPVLSMTGESNAQFKFSKDGRTVVWLEDELTTYQVDPALEYRTFAHAFGERIRYETPSIRCDGRVLALGTGRGVALWDLARGVELPFLPIGITWYSLFEASGDLLTLTSGSLGVQRWPVELDPNRGEFRIGPPRQLPLPEGLGIAEDRTGRIVALARGADALVSTPERTIRVGPLDDCRTVAVSPDGQWLATRSYYFINGAQVWHIPDGARVADLKVEGRVGVAFSLDGKWLMTSAALGRRHLERGAADRRYGVRLFPGQPIGGRRGRDEGPPPGRDRDWPHGRTAREPGPLRSGTGDIQPRRVAPGREHQ